MLSRVGAAVCAAAAVVMLAAPLPSSARGGAAAMGHAGGFHPPVSSFNHARPPMVRPPLAHQPLVHAHRAPLLRHEFNGHHAFGGAARRNQGATIGYVDPGGYSGPLTYSDDGAFYGSYYDPSDWTGWIYPRAPKVPSAAVVPVAGREAQVVDRGGCRSETVAVPSPGSAENNVTITRC